MFTSGQGLFRIQTLRTKPGAFTVPLQEHLNTVLSSAGLAGRPYRVMTSFLLSKGDSTGLREPPYPGNNNFYEDVTCSAGHF